MCIAVDAERQRELAGRGMVVGHLSFFEKLFHIEKRDVVRDRVAGFVYEVARFELPDEPCDGVAQLGIIGHVGLPHYRPSRSSRAFGSGMVGDPARCGGSVDRTVVPAMGNT